jgi:hypothetical protein
MIRLHHFIADGVWDATPVESELLIQVDRLVGGNDAVLVSTTLRCGRRANTRSASPGNMLWLLAKRQTAKRRCR